VFVGHLAVALTATRIEPRAPFGALVGAAFGLDLLWPPLLLLGVEQVRIDPGNTAFTPLAFVHYPWSHSLSMAVIWAVFAGRVSIAVLKHVNAGLLIGLVVLSHWALDFVTHRPDLPLWPGGPVAGLGLWNSVAATILVEGGLFIAAVILYERSTRPRRPAGRWAWWGLVAFTAAIWISGPWAPPPPSATAVAVVGLLMLLFVPWAVWIDRTRDRVRTR
jgi:hypothetical protein